jgi:hypothetical protein
MLKQTRNKLATLGGGTQEATKDSTEAPSLGIGYNSGVEESVSTAVEGTGLITLEKTPEPESIALARSTGDGRTKLPRRLSSIGEEDEQPTKSAREVHLTNTRRGGYSPTDRAQDPNTDELKDSKRADGKLFAKDSEAHEQGEPQPATPPTLKLRRK